MLVTLLGRDVKTSRWITKTGIQDHENHVYPAIVPMPTAPGAEDEGYTDFRSGESAPMELVSNNPVSYKTRIPTNSPTDKVYILI